MGGMMRVFLSGALLTVAFVSQAPGQTQPALVTFYSAGCRFCAKDLMVATFAGSAVVPYGGAIYDGSVKLIKSMHPNQFLTVRMEPGQHTFAGESMGILDLKYRRAKGSDLLLILQPGQHYFVSFTTKDAGITYTFRRLTPILAEKGCQEAYREAAETEPTPPKGIGKAFLADVQPSFYFPGCDASATSSH
jgi:hypothetical protein